MIITIKYSIQYITATSTEHLRRHAAAFTLQGFVNVRLLYAAQSTAVMGQLAPVLLALTHTVAHIGMSN